MNKWGAAFTGVLCCLAAVEACSSDSGSADTTTGADAGADAKRPPTDSGTPPDFDASCTDLAQQGSEVFATLADAGAVDDAGDAGDAGNTGAPLPTGGTVALGTYLLTAVEVYGSTVAPSTPDRDTLRISAQTLEQIVEGSMDLDLTGSWSTNGTELRVVLGCVEGKDAKKVGASFFSFQYDATPTMIRTYNTRLGATNVRTYTKQ